MRTKRLVWNSVTSLISQITALVCGFILPRLILNTFGTEVNGLVSSVTQFLTVVSLSEFGMTAVVQSSLYRPLAENDEVGVSKVMASSNKFFRRIGGILIIYMIGLCALYPVLVRSDFDYLYISAMVLILSINSLAQYLFGITNAQLLSSDQRIYVTSITEIFVTIMNTIACYMLIKIGAGIHAVKLTTAVVFLIKPIVQAIYVKKNYNVNWKIKYKEEPIKQKWNGVAQHISHYIFTSTDAAVLSIFSSLANVSIYTVYALVFNGLKQLCQLLENGVKPLLGEVWAKGNMTQLRTYFSEYEWFMHIISIFLYGCAATLIVPFVTIYTKGVSDANYVVPIFSMVMSIAYAFQNIRTPYNSIIQAVGHYKQTQSNYIVVALLNVVISVVMVSKFGLVGVAIGTLVAAAYQVIWQAQYIYRNILNFPIWKFAKILLIDTASFTIGCLLTRVLPIASQDYLHWAIMAIPVALIWFAVICLFSIVFYGNEIRTIIKCFIKR